MSNNKYRDIFEKASMSWPYEVRYGKVNRLKCDVLVLGGGIAGCRAAIAAAKEGANVIVVDKAPIKRSGTGGTGHDHWLSAATNPASKVTPEEFVEKGGQNWMVGPIKYILPKTSWDTLAELEEMGLIIRDAKDEFKGAPFRDEKSKLLYCYDYENKIGIRLYGGNQHKPTLDKEIERLHIKKVERVMATKLLYRDIDGKRYVNGAVGIHAQTGEAYVFEAKKVIITTGIVYGMWTYRNDVLGATSEFGDPNSSGDGHAMAWDIGAEVTNMESAGTKAANGAVNGQPAYGGGSCGNTHYPCNIVDADGKQIPWVDHEGKVIDTVLERSQPRSGIDFMTDGGSTMNTSSYMLIPDLAQRIANGEYKLPLYMDLPGMPKEERRAIWGLMVGNEGKTLHAVYNKYSKAGFNPDKDMLQVNLMDLPEYNFSAGGWWNGQSGPKDRDSGNFNGAGAITTNWDLASTNIGSLYVAGSPMSATGASQAAAGGRYAGRKAAIAAQDYQELPIDEEQIDAELKRIYEPLERDNADIGWRELQAALTRVMRDYLDDYKSLEKIRIGKLWLKSLKETENTRVYVRNPHELMRYLEIQSRFTVAEMFFTACEKRIEHDGQEYVNKMFFPWADVATWGKLQVLKKVDDQVTAEYWEPYYELKEPYAASYRENFYHFNPDYDEKYKAKEDDSWKTLKQY